MKTLMTIYCLAVALAGAAILQAHLPAVIQAHAYPAPGENAYPAPGENAYPAPGENAYPGPAATPTTAAPAAYTMTTVTDIAQTGMKLHQVTTPTAQPARPEPTATPDRTSKIMGWRIIREVKKP